MKASQASTAAPTAGTAQTPKAGRNAGRGLLWMTSAQLFFIVSGYAVQLLLPRLLGSPEEFGLFSLALSIVSMLNNVLIAATVQTVSRHVSQDLPAAPATLRQALWLQLGIGASLASLLWGTAPWLARTVLLDAKLAPLLRLSSIVVFSYALYAALVGSLNGRQLFHRQALLNVAYTSLRLLGMLGAAALGWGARGTMAGMAGAAVAVLLLASLTVGLGQEGQRTPWRSWWAFMGPLWLYQLCLSLALQVDLSVLKGTVAALAIDTGIAAEPAAETASRMAAFYRAAQTFAFVPYQLILSVTFVVFPIVAEAHSSGDVVSSRRYVQNALRFSLLVLLAIAAPVSGAAHGVMRIAYNEAYLAGAGALALLAPGMVCFALFVIGATILNSAGRPQLPALIAIGTVITVVTCNWLFVRSVGLGAHTLQAAAAGTAVGMGGALCAIGAAVYARFRTFIAWRSVLRMLLAAAVAWWIAHIVPSHDKWLALCALVAGGVSFVVTALIAGEITAEDVGRVRTLLRRRQRKTPQEI